MVDARTYEHFFISGTGAISRVDPRLTEMEDEIRVLKIKLKEVLNLSKKGLMEINVIGSPTYEKLMKVQDVYMVLKGFLEYEKEVRESVAERRCLGQERKSGVKSLVMYDFLVFEER